MAATLTEIRVKQLAKYKDVELVVDFDTKISLGLMDDKECMALAKTLKSAILYLLETDQYQQLMSEDE